MSIMSILAQDARGESKTFTEKTLRNRCCRRRISGKKKQTEEVKALSHGVIFLATCDAVLLLRDVNLRQMFGMLKIY